MKINYVRIVNKQDLSAINPAKTCYGFTWFVKHFLHVF